MQTDAGIGVWLNIFFTTSQCVANMRSVPNATAASSELGGKCVALPVTLAGGRSPGDEAELHTVWKGIKPIC